MTKTEKGDKELDKQELVFLEDFGHDSRHTHIYVTGTQANTGNLLFNITGIGTVVKNKYDKPEFRYSYRDMPWEHIEGDVTNAGIPLLVYGNAWSAYFKPGNYYSNKNFRLNVQRRGAATGLNADQYREKKYKTYYLKPME